jgi:hypothetical protein
MDLLRGEQRKSAKAVSIKKTRSAQRENMEPASRKQDKAQREFEGIFNGLHIEQQITLLFLMAMRAFPLVRFLVYAALAIGAIFLIVGIITGAPEAIIVGVALLVGFILGMLFTGGGFRSK